jgi:transposase
MRYELTDGEWATSDRLPNKARGVPRVDDWRVLNGIFCVLRSGAPWRDLPTVSVDTRLATTALCAGDVLESGAA